jgi:parvulin-like peptidyl-prolyl isomerase
MLPRPILLLLLGTGLGIVAAAAGLVDTAANRGRLPGDAVARVNDTVIRRDDYERLVAAAAQDRREPLDAAMRRHVLDRLIEEELLVQRGLELGLAEHDRKVRADLSMAVIAAVTDEFGETEASDTDLLEFYDGNRGFFAGPGRVRLRQVFVRVPRGADADAILERARAAATRLGAGEDFATVRADLGDEEFAPVPDSLLPPAKLRDYVGPTALQTALRLREDEISDPVRSSMGFHVLQVLERQPDQAPRFEEVRAQVLGEYRRRAGEEALRRYLDELRGRAEVEVIEPLP